MSIQTDQLIRRIWTAHASSGVMPFRSVRFADGTSPQLHGCEHNVMRWTDENPADEAVPAWLATGMLVQKHWVVRSRGGPLLNITPLQTDTPIFEHPGPISEFRLLNEEIHLVLFQHLRPES
jgi:hypothetical protein